MSGKRLFSGRAFFSGLLFFCFLPLAAEQITVHAVNPADGASKSVVPVTNEFCVKPDHVVVGQGLVCQCIVTYDPRRVNIRGLVIPEYQNVIFHEPFQGPAREQIDVDGVQMVRLIWSARAYPRHAGAVRLPGIDLEYGTINERRSSHFFSWAFSREEQLHRLKSADASVTIAPLPVAHPIDAVGQYSACTIRADRTNIVQGEAIALTVSVLGNGNAGFEPTFSLSTPQGCTWYRDGAARTAGGAQFKFVLQCNEAGTFELPAQQYHCYDPLKKKFYVISTDPLTIAVSPAAASVARAVVDMHAEPEVDDVKAPLEQLATPSLVRKAEIPLPMFLFLCALVLLIMFCWRWWAIVLRVLRRFKFFVGRAGALGVLYLRVKRNRLRARDAYQFFVQYVGAARADGFGPGWNEFWLELQHHYFGGRPEALLSRGEGEQVLFWARRIAVPRRRRDVTISCVLLIFCTTQAVGDVPSIGQQIKNMRAAQRHVSLSGYDELERKIEELRRPAGSCRRYGPLIARVCRWSHLLPLFLWQLLFLCFLALIFVRRTRLFAFVMLGVIAIAVCAFYYEHSGRWRCIIADAPLYLGPGSGYPIRRELVSGDEVRFVRSLSEKDGAWLLVDACGEKGWLPHDVVV